MVGMDFGRTPSALICQVDTFGRLFVFKEIVTEDMGLVQMLEEKLLPALSVPPFAGRRVFVVADPAGNHKTEIRDETAFSTLKDHGFLAYPAVTNDPDKRILAVEKLLRARLAGEPGLQINRGECPTLVHAMGNKYRYRKKKDGQLEERPEKLHPWSDICDALQYACLGVQANLAGKVVARDGPRGSGRPPFTAKAWT